MKSVETPSAIRVWCSSELERLAARLIKNLGARKESVSSRLFTHAPIIVPNQNIETYLKYEIARGAGIAAGLDFFRIESFLASLLPLKDKSRRQPKLLDPATLRSFFLDVFCEESPSKPLPDAVTGYLAAAGDDRDARDFRRFQLASQLAGLARRYGERRPELLQKWAQGSAMLDQGPFAGTEEWQRALWARVIEKYETPAASEKAAGIDWILPLTFFAELENVDVTLPEEIHIFGFSYMWRGLREMLDHLRKKTIVNIYTFSPSEQLWNQLANLASWPEGAPVFHARPGLPIVENWARPGFEYVEMLSEITPVEVHHDFADIPGSGLLSRFRREILRDEADDGAPFALDQSLTILGCPGIRREAEVVANEIWRLIRDDDRKNGSSAGRLRFCEIAVLLADSANQAAYQAHFRAAFDELYGIPFNMVDVPIAGECRVIEALLLLLELPLGEFNRPNVLKILTHPAVRARYPDVETSQWRDWCLELEIVHGIDQSDHEGTYIDQNLFHWEQGLRRLVLGTCMTGADAGETPVFRLDNQDYVPHDFPADALPSVALLLVLARSLAADVRFARSAQLTMTEWSRCFAGMVDAYLGAEAGVEAGALSACRQKIGKLRDLDVTGRKFGYRIACESLRQEIEDWTETRGHYLADGVVVSPLLEMRSLPFRVVFLCGLGEGRFPAADGPDPLDLTLAHRQLGDVSPRERDKYLFLETLACARDHLYLSYVDRDAQTGDPLEPSSVVSELIRHLHRGRPGLPSKTWLQEQPLRRFDDSYFRDGEPGGETGFVRFNCSPAARGEHSARKLRESLRKQVHDVPRLELSNLRRLEPDVREFLGLCPVEPLVRSASQPLRLSISVQSLRQFLECPLQGWARLMLKLRDDEEEDEAAREDEPFVTGRLDQSTLLREAFIDFLNTSAADTDPARLETVYDQHVESRRRRGLMPIGLFGDVERRRHLAYLAEWHQAASRRQLLSAGPYQICRFGRAAEAEKVDLLLPPIVLDIPSNKSPRPVRVELFGRTEILSGQRSGSITPVVRDSAGNKDYLRGFLDSIVLSSLLGRDGSAAYHADVIPTGKTGDSADLRRIFRDIDQERARGYLTTLLTDLLGGPHAYLLPCEAVFAWISEGKSVKATVESMKENDRSTCSSRYGPIRDFNQYEPPSDEEAEAIITRRFGLFRESGGMA